MNENEKPGQAETTHQEDDRAAARGDAPVGQESAPPTSPLDMAKERIVELEGALETAKRRELLAEAELDNFRKRVRREMEDDRRFAALPVIQDLLPVGDDLARALESAKGDASSQEPIVAGVAMVLSRFKSVLERQNCREIEASGQFDANVHEAVAQVPSDRPPGTILQVARSGYRLYDRVVRPAQVVVSAGKPG